jgi:hypothetical protein
MQSGWSPPCVVDLPESYKDALAGVTGTFWASFQPISSRLEAFGKVFQLTTLNRGTTAKWEAGKHRQNTSQNTRTSQLLCSHPLILMNEALRLNLVFNPGRIQKE